ncbi:hypothetical protein [Candidatus Ichthyocystis sparus]|nr:hypothetical protein [Candidatus Ichthyocystis sparus]
MPHLSTVVVGVPREVLFRSMFCGTSRVSLVSSLVVQLLNKLEVLVRS